MDRALEDALGMAAQGWGEEVITDCGARPVARDDCFRAGVNSGSRLERKTLVQQCERVRHNSESDDQVPRQVWSVEIVHQHSRPAFNPGR